MKLSCKKTKKKLLPFLTGRTDEKSTRAVKEHLDRCSVCRHAAAELHTVWELLETPSTHETFRDIVPEVLVRITSVEPRTGLLAKAARILLAAPTPALGTLIALIALPLGIYLGQGLYRTTGYAWPLGEELSLRPDELPFDMFNDFPGESLESLYINLAEKS